MTASDYTLLAVPAILNGRLPDAPRLPIAPDHPQSIFSLLGDSYAMNVSESVTHICPARLCDSGGRSEGFSARLRSLADDLRILYLHVLLPDDWTDHLPPVTQNWMLFADQDDWLSDWKRRGEGDHSEQVERFIAGIRPVDGPVLHFLHALLPHPPFGLPAVGPALRPNEFRPGLKGDKMADDEWAATQIQQRHLLQLGYVDRLLGKTIARLRETGVWDRAVVVVTADHGAAFSTRLNRAPRGLPKLRRSPGGAAPDQGPRPTRGRFDERAASLVDVLPTVADLAGIELPWPVGGISLAGPATPDRQLLEVVPHRNPMAEPIEVSLARLRARGHHSLRVLDRRFGRADDGGRDLYRIGASRDWIGRGLSDLPMAAPASFKFRLSWPASALDVEPDSRFIPAHLSGQLVGYSASAPVELAGRGERSHRRRAPQLDLRDR